MGSANVQGVLWGTHAQDWASLAEPCTSGLWMAVLDAAGVGAGTRLLDMGCGGGGLASLAEARGATVYGIDASESLIKIAQSRAPEGKFEVGDLESLPFPAHSFDVVTACNSIQFAADQRKAVGEARRVLTPEGKFVIGMWSDPEHCDMTAVFQAVMQAAPPPPGGGTPSPSLSVRDNLVALVESGGLKVNEVSEVDCIFQFADDASAWRALRSAGILVGVAKAIGEDRLKDIVMDAAAPFKRDDGSYRMANEFRYVLATR